MTENESLALDRDRYKAAYEVAIYNLIGVAGNGHPGVSEATNIVNYTLPAWKTSKEWDELEKERDGLKRAYVTAIRQMNDAIAKAEWFRTDAIAELQKSLRELIDLNETTGDPDPEITERARALLSETSPPLTRYDHAQRKNIIEARKRTPRKGGQRLPGASC